MWCLVVFVDFVEYGFVDVDVGIGFEVGVFVGVVFFCGFE